MKLAVGFSGVLALLSIILFPRRPTFNDSIVQSLKFQLSDAP